MPNHTQQLFRQGRRRLRAMMPAARIAVKQGVRIFDANTLFDAMRPWVTEANMDALLIYKAPLGGWHCDLVLKNVPPGVPNTAGSPVAQPHDTLADAQSAAEDLMAFALKIADDNANTAAGPIQEARARGAFLLYDLSVRLYPDMLAKAVQSMPGNADGYGTKEFAIQRIKETLSELLPMGVTMETTAALSRNNSLLLMTVLHIAALSGVFAYPARVDAFPASPLRAWAP